MTCGMKARVGRKSSTDASWISRELVTMRQQVSGSITGGATPDPIPNSEVKPSRADGTARSSVWESRTLPEFFLGPQSKDWGPFLFRRMFFFGKIRGGPRSPGMIPTGETVWVFNGNRNRFPSAIFATQAQAER